MKEYISKGIDYVWHNLRFNPVKEALVSGAGFLAWKKPIRNGTYCVLLVGGMVGGFFLFTQEGTFYGYANDLVSAGVDSTVLAGLSEGTKDTVTYILTGLFGSWVLGSVVGTGTKHVFRAANKAIGGHTNGEYNLRGVDLDKINEELGIEYEDDEDLGQCQRVTGSCLQHTFPISCMPGLQSHFVQDDRWDAQLARQGEINEIVSDLDRRKFDGTHRHGEIKFALSSLLNYSFGPLVRYFRNRQQDAQDRQEQAEQAITDINGIVGDLEDGEHQDRNAIVDGADEGVMRRLLQLAKFLKENNKDRRQYNVLPSKSKKSQAPDQVTYGFLYDLRRDAITQQAKMVARRDHDAEVSNRYRQVFEV